MTQPTTRIPTASQKRAYIIIRREARMHLFYGRRASVQGYTGLHAYHLDAARQCRTDSNFLR